MIIALAYFSASKTTEKKLFHFCVATSCAWLLLLGGSRVSAAMAALLPFMWMAVQRRYFLILFLTACIGTGIGLLNANPDMLEHLPLPGQRALSIFVLGERLDVQAQQRGSNDWHAYLFKLGRDRWLASPLSITLGNRIRPFDITFYSPRIDFFHQAEIAANTARYERSLWTVITTTGVVGGLLYAATFMALLRGPTRRLFRDGLTDFRHIVYFMAFTHSALWIIFSPVSGGFPGNQLMWAGIAYTMYYDLKHRAPEAAEKGARAAATPPEKTFRFWEHV
jgi:hypothetical protein